MLQPQLQSHKMLDCEYIYIYYTILFGTSFEMLHLSLIAQHPNQNHYSREGTMNTPQYMIFSFYILNHLETKKASLAMRNLFPLSLCRWIFMSHAHSTLTHCARNSFPSNPWGSFQNMQCTLWQSASNCMLELSLKCSHHTYTSPLHDLVPRPPFFTM